MGLMLIVIVGSLGIAGLIELSNSDDDSTDEVNTAEEMQEPNSPPTRGCDRA